MWTLNIYTSSLGQTGDYSTEVELTNGEIKLYCYNDLIETDELQELCDKLNKE